MRTWAALAVVAALIGVTIVPASATRVGETAPEIEGGGWINGGPLRLSGLRGRVVLVEFWTYG